MEVGQPGTPAPAAARAALAAGDGGGAARLHRGARAAGAPRAHRPALPRLVRGRSRPGPGRRDRRLLGRLHPRLHPLFERGEKVAIGEPGYPCYRNILRALDLEPVGIATGPEDRFQPTPRDLTPDLAGVLVASPANPTGTMLAASELARADRARRRARPRLRLRRDLPRHPVRRPRRLGARDLRRGLRHQLVLEVLLDDRLADRLDGGARGARPPHRAAGAELLHLRPARQPGGGAGRARRDAPSSTPTSPSTAPTAR